MPPRAPIATGDTPALPKPQLPSDAPPWFRQWVESWYKQNLRVFDRMQQRIDTLQGLRSAPRLNAPLSMQENAITALPDPTTPDNPVTLRYLQQHALLKNAAGIYELNAPLDAKNFRLRHLGQTRDARDATNRGENVGQISGALDLFTTQDHTWTGLQTFDRDPSVPFVVTSGSAKVTNLDADQWDGFDYLAGSDTVTGHGFSVEPTGTARWNKLGNLVILFLPQLQGTSSATTFTITGLNAAIVPTLEAWHPVVALDNSVWLFGTMHLTPASGTIELFAGPSTGNTWTNSGTKLSQQTWLAYAQL